MSQWFRPRGVRAAGAAIGLIAAAGVGVAFASMPDRGEGSTARAASPVVAIAAEREAGSFEGVQTVLSVRVSSGLYAVNAKVVLRTEDTTTTACKLAIGTKTIDASRTLHADFFTTRDSTHALQFAGRLRGVLKIVCNAEAWRAEMAKITAIRLTSLTKKVV